MAQQVISVIHLISEDPIAWLNNGREPRCEAVCDVLPQPDNGRLVCSGRSLGDTCELECRDR